MTHYLIQLLCVSNILFLSTAFFLDTFVGDLHVLFFLVSTKMVPNFLSKVRE